MLKAEVLKRSGSSSVGSGWIQPEVELGAGPGWRCSIGLLVLATDRVGARDTEEFLDGLDGVGIFSSRVPMSPVATPASLAAMGRHLEAATALLVPGSKLDVVAFSCTSGTVAIGSDVVRESIRRARPGVHVTTPIEAGAEALQQLGARKIGLLAPYRRETADLVSGYFEDHGFSILSKATFGLDGDPEMNWVTGESLMAAAAQMCDPAMDALFISCTGLRTAPIVARLEEGLGKPVITSNQALAWHSLRLAGVRDAIAGKGRLFHLDRDSVELSRGPALPGARGRPGRSR